MKLNLRVDDDYNFRSHSVGRLTIEETDFLKILNLEEDTNEIIVEDKNKKERFSIILDGDTFEYLALKLGYKLDKRPISHWIDKAKVEAYNLTKQLKRAKKEMEIENETN